MGELLRRLPAESDKNVVGVILAIGVNDAQRGRTTTVRQIVWLNDYRKLVATIRKRFGGNIIVCTIVPVEGSKPLGEKYFDPDTITGFNTYIRRLARDERLAIADLDQAFRTWQPSSGSYTTDGVHLTPEAYEWWFKVLSAAAATRVD